MAHPWTKYKEEMKLKCTAANKKKEDRDCSSMPEELVVQRLSSKVTGKLQKYTRVGARQFVPFSFREVTIPNIRHACKEHFYSKKLIGGEMEADILAGEQGPSCQMMKHLKDLKVIFVRFVTRTELEAEETDFTNSSDLQGESAAHKRRHYTNPLINKSLAGPSNSRQIMSEPEAKTYRSPLQGEQVTSMYPKSLSVADMLKLGKVVVRSPTTMIKVFSFDTCNMAWSKITRNIEFVVEEQPIGQGGFRVAYKATCATLCPDFSGKSWVVKKFLPETLDTLKALNQTPEEHAKRVVQMHHLARYLTQQLVERIQKEDVAEEFGQHFQFKKVFLGVMDTGDCVTIEEFIEGTFVKYINNTGLRCVNNSNSMGQKAECLVHFTNEKSQEKLIVVDLQGSGYTLYDPEIASYEAVIDGNILFCAGNLNIVAITNFIKNHECNIYCRLIGLSEFPQE